jgi:tetratricopeptide (TPR) repeat protein
VKKQILILLIILPGIAGFLSGQKAGILHLADSLSKASWYNASNEVLHQFIRDNPKRLYDLSTAYFLMSYNFLQLGDYESSIVSNGESLRLRERLRTDDLAENYMRLGAVQLVQGDYERAMHNFFKARELPYESPRLFSMINGYLATAYLEMGEYERANKAYLQSLEILKIDLGESHPDVSAIYYNIGQVFLREGRPSLAESALFLSLGLERQRSEPSVMIGLVQNALGDAARLDGRVPDALDYYRQALSVFQKLFGERHRETARVYLNMARVQITGGDLSAARESIRLAVMSLCPASDEGLTLDRLLLANVMELRAEAALAEFEKTKQISDLESALAAAREGIALVEQQLNFQGASAARFRLTENQTGLFEKGILAAFQLYEQSRDFQHAAAAFEMMERAKRMDIRANNVQMIQTSNLYPELKAKETLARVALTEAEIEFARQPDDGEVQTRVVRERDNFLKLIREVEGLDPGYFNLRYGPPLISLEEAQAGIGPTTALASYFLGKEQYYILAFTAEEVRPVRLPNGFSVDLKKESGRSPEIDQAVDGFIHAVKNTEADKFVFFSSDLYGKLIDPIADILEKKDRLIIIPHGKLHNVPFEALISRAPKKDRLPEFGLPASSIYRQLSLFGGSFLRGTALGGNP